MGNKQTNYFNCEATEMVNRYYSKVNITRIICLIINIAIMVWIIFDRSVSTYLKGIALVLNLGVFNIISSFEFQKLLNVLLVNCDPYKFLEILKMLDKRAKKDDTKNGILYYKTMCCLYMKGHEEEGLAYLKSINFKSKKLLRETNILLQYANYSKLNNDRNSFDVIMKDLEKLPRIIKHNKNQKKKYDYKCKLFKMLELAWDEKDTELRPLLNNLLQEDALFINKVIFHMYLAKLDMKSNEKKNARFHLDYVIKNGNKLRIVEEAEELIEKLTEVNEEQ